MNPPVGEAWQNYRAELLGFVRRRVPDNGAAEDLVHDVLIKAYTHQADLKSPTKLRSWLFQIARNSLVDYYRSKKPMEPLPQSLDIPAEEQESSAERELATCLRPLLEELPSHYREPLWLADFQGVSQQAVAQRLGLSLPGAKSRVQRARRMLREILLKCCLVELDRHGGIAGYENLEHRDCDASRNGKQTCSGCEP